MSTRILGLAPLALAVLLAAGCGGNNKDGGVARPSIQGGNTHEKLEPIDVRNPPKGKTVAKPGASPG